MIDTEATRSKILQLAVTGMLAENHHSTITAKSIVDGIKNEYLGLLKAKATKKKKDAPMIAEGLFTIPSTWEWVPLGSLCTFLSRGRAPKYSTEELYPVFAQKCNQPKGLALDKARFLDKETLSKWAPYFRLQEGDVIINSTGTGTMGRVGFYSTETLDPKYPFMLPDSHVTVARFGSNVVPKYIFYALRTPKIQLIMERQFRGSTNQKEFYIDSAYATPVPLPPYEEQLEIVAKLDVAFYQLDQIEQFQNEYFENARVIREKTIDAGIKGDLTVEWRNEHGFSVSDWVEQTIGACFDVVGGIQKKPNRTPRHNPVPYVTVANVYRNRIDLTDLRYFELFDGELERLQLKDKDILVVEGNGSGGEIGRCAMWENQLPVCVHQNHIIRLRCTDDDVLPEYVLLFLNSPTGKAVVRERAKTTTGLYNLSAGKIRTIPVPRPSLEEQKQIVERVDELLQALTDSEN